MTNILLTSVGRRVELVRRFHAAYQTLGIRGNIVAADVDWLAPALQVVDRPYLVPRFDAVDYVPRLAEICENENIALVLPLIDPEIPILAAGRSALEATGTKVGVVTADAARIATDKWETFLCFSQNKIPAPRSCTPTEWGEASLTFPVIVKPRTGSAGQGIMRADNDADIRRLQDDIDSYIIQEIVDGPEVTVDVVCDLEGQLLASVPRQRIAVRGGEAIKSVTIDNDQILDHCAQIAKQLPAAGPITVQCMMDGQQPRFIEINARLGGGVPLSIAAGIDIPAILLSIAAGLATEHLTANGYRRGVYMTRCDESFFLSELDRARIEGPELKAVIFDLDDTLYPESDFVQSGFAATANWIEQAFDVPQDEALDELLAIRERSPTQPTFKRWLLLREFPESHEPQLVSAYRTHVPQIQLFDGVRDLLVRLRERFQLAIVTDGFLAVQEQKVKALQLEPLFDAIIYSDAFGREHWKPHPRPFVEALARLSVNANEAVYVADNPVKDFLGARRAGVYSIWIKRPRGVYAMRKPSSPEADADLTITDLNQLELAILAIVKRVTHQ